MYNPAGNVLRGQGVRIRGGGGGGGRTGRGGGRGRGRGRGRGHYYHHRRPHPRWPLYSGLPYWYRQPIYMPVTVNCNQQNYVDTVNFANASCSYGASDLETQLKKQEIAAQMNCCAGYVPWPVPGATCQSSGMGSSQAYTCIPANDLIPSE